MFYYIQVTEKSYGSGEMYPHFEFELVSQIEALDWLRLNSYGRNSISEIPTIIDPLIITNDLNICLLYRQAFNLIEFKKWCSVELSEDDKKYDRRFYSTNNPGFKFDKNIKKAYELVNGIANGKFTFAIHSKGSTEEYWDNNRGERFLMVGEYYDEWSYGYEEEKKHLTSDSNYLWWDSLHINWKNLFIKEFIHLFYDNIPTKETLLNIINVQRLVLLSSDFYSNDSKCFSLKPLLHLNKIKKLNISLGLCLDEIENLKNLINLEVLILNGNKINTMDFLDGFRELKVLDISYNPIENIKTLYALPKLEILNIRGTNIKEIPPLRAINEIQISENQFSTEYINYYCKLLGKKIYFNDGSVPTQYKSYM